MRNVCQNQRKVNRFANRQSDSIRIASNSFRFSANCVSNRLYITCFRRSELPSGKNPTRRSKARAGDTNFVVCPSRGPSNAKDGRSKQRPYKGFRLRLPKSPFKKYRRDSSPHGAGLRMTNEPMSAMQCGIEGVGMSGVLMEVPAGAAPINESGCPDQGHRGKLQSHKQRPD